MPPHIVVIVLLLLLVMLMMNCGMIWRCCSNLRRSSESVIVVSYRLVRRSLLIRPVWTVVASTATAACVLVRRRYTAVLSEVSLLRWCTRGIRRRWRAGVWIWGHIVVSWPYRSGECHRGFPY